MGSTNFSELVQAVRDDDRDNANRLLTEIRPRLIRFLNVHMNASVEDARDCVQESLLVSLRAIREGRIRKPEQMFSYLLTTCRNQYLKMLDRRKESYFETPPDSTNHAPRQLSGLLDRERQEILAGCLDELKDDHRAFIDYWFEHPDSDARTVADHFGISVNNAWTRKHRIIKKLNRCYEEKIKQ